MAIQVDAFGRLGRSRKALIRRHVSTDIQYRNAGVAKPGQRRQIEGLVSQESLSSNLSPRTTVSFQS